MSPASLPFLVLFIAATVVAGALSVPRSRRSLLFVLNCAFLATHVPNWESWAALGAFLLWTYGVLVLARRDVATWVLVLAASLVVLGYLYAKKYVFLEFLLPTSILGHPIGLVGVSYMLFKFLHMAVDLRQRQPMAPSLPAYLNYQLSFFTLIAGPIQRYGEYERFWNSMEGGDGDRRELLGAWNRLLNGILKMSLLASVAQVFYDRAAAGLVESSETSSLMARFAICFYAFPLYLYFNFSGYTDVAIGSARLFGLRLPENFDRPFLARNVVDFWNRWHITLTTWVRDYIFMFAYKWIAERLQWAAKGAGYVLTCVSLVIVGIWHGSTWNFLVFGLIHGLGAMTTQIYGSALKGRLKQRGLKAYHQSPWVRRIAIVATFHFVSASFLFFAEDLQVTLDRLRLLAGRIL